MFEVTDAEIKEENDGPDDHVLDASDENSDNEVKLFSEVVTSDGVEIKVVLVMYDAKVPIKVEKQEYSVGRLVISGGPIKIKTYQPV